VRRIGLVSDTHGLLRPEVAAGLAGVERILHMGDVGRPEVLDELGRIAPVLAVRGNVDHGGWAERLPRTAAADLFGAPAFLVHDVADLDLDPRAAGLRFVLHGHSHVPRDEERDGVRFVNPGACGPRRFSLPVSFALLGEDLAVRFVCVE
jgi:putative phosphoesterase